jgi:N-6 DNA Methylase
LGSRNGAIATYVTPAADVAATCRLSIAWYLGATDAATPAPLLRHLLAAGAGSNPTDYEDGAWKAAQANLDNLRVLDPACGDGAFLHGMLDVLECAHELLDRRLNRERSAAARRADICSKTLCGVDVQPSLIQKARRRLQLASGAAANFATADSLVDPRGSSWESRFSEVVDGGGFDIVIGNPPFLRHERIADPLTQLSPAEYRNRVTASMKSRLPDLQLPGGRADLALYFVFLGMGLLRPRGVLGFVLPDSVFDAAYSRCLGEALHSTGREGLVLRSLTSRSFLSASVNTSILILGPKEMRRASDTGDSLREDTVRVVEVDEPLDRVELSQVLIARHRRSSSPVRIAHRAAETTLGDLGHLRYALKSGLNGFFYPDAEAIGRFAIEPEFLRPLLKSPRDVRTLTVAPNSLSHRVFACSRSLEELRQMAKHGSLAYIDWGSRQHTAGREWSPPVPWPAAPSLRGRRFWYALSLPTPADFVLPRFFDRRFFISVCAAPLVEDQTFYGLVLAPDLLDMRDALAGLLNCSMTLLALERAGRGGLGDGVRQFALSDYLGLKVFDVRRLKSACAEEIAQSFRLLASRPILPVEEEIRQTDRRVLDDAVASAVGLGQHASQRIRRELEARVAQRITRARDARLRSRGE